jgi:hypothetical protein
VRYANYFFPGEAHELKTSPFESKIYHGALQRVAHEPVLKLPDAIAVVLSWAFKCRRLIGTS